MTVKKPKTSLGWYVAAFLAMFMAFMTWYFLICQNIDTAPSDWALMAIAVVCAVECVATAFIKTRPAGKGLTDSEKDMVAFAARVAASALDIEPPSMREAAEGQPAEEDGDDDTDDESESEGEIYG